MKKQTKTHKMFEFNSLPKIKTVGEMKNVEELDLSKLESVLITVCFN